jgi:NADH-quinone oxidoreductase subunit G
MNFDDLPDYYTNTGEEIRGYELETYSVEPQADETVNKIDESAAMDGDVIYLANPVRQFTDFTYKTTYLDEKSGLYVSEEALAQLNLNEGDSVKVTTQNGELVTQIVSDNKIAGNIVILPTFDSNLNAEALVNGYRFATASIKKV